MAIVNDWVTNTVYKVNELVYIPDGDPSTSVQYHDRLYRAINQHTSNSFGTDFGNGLWDQIQVKGVKGDTGDQGPIGPSGTNGGVGPSGPSGGDGADGVFSVISSKSEAEVGFDNTKGMTPLRTREAIDFNLVTDRAQIATNVAGIASNLGLINTNIADIAAIVIDNAQIATNKNDIASNLLLINTNTANIAAIVIDNAQIAANQADIATINNTTIPALVDEINKNKAEIGVIKNATELVNASGQQRLNNNQLVPEDIKGDVTLGTENGKGNSWELNPVGAKSARIRAEIYRKDDAEVRFSVAHLEMHFLDDLGQWFLERVSTTVLSGDDDGVTFAVTTGAANVGQVNYISDDMIGGNYSADSYVKFLLEEISNF